MSGQQKIIPRWQRCVQRSENLLAQATSALFIRKHFNSEIQREVTVSFDLFLKLKIELSHKLKILFGKNLNWKIKVKFINT